MQSIPQQIALVVDDSMLIRHTVCRFLEQRGFSVASAANGVEAMHILSNVLPDLIVTDLMMPKMTGSELITAVKANPRMARIPVVVLAGRSSAAASPLVADTVLIWTLSGTICTGSRVSR